MFAIDGIWVGEFATAEYIAPLTDVVGPEADDWDGWAQINDAVQANASFDGNRYGIPQGTDGRVIYFNKDLFEQAGLPDRLGSDDDRRGARRRPHDQGEAARRHPDPAQRRRGDG